MIVKRLADYIKEYGLKKTCRDIYEYQIDKFYLKIIKVIFKNKELQNTIIIESHNDFDCNGGAFYEYLIDKHYNKKYKIVWLIKHKEFVPKKLPKNVLCYQLFAPSFMKMYYEWVAKYYITDCYIEHKKREEQTAVHCTHGAVGLKDVTGLCDIPDCVDYILFPSDRLHAKVLAGQYRLPYPNKRFLHIGYPVHDIICGKSNGEIKKITDKEYDKVILWMPTFRKSITSRNDSTSSCDMGVPLIEDMESYEKLNEYLKSRNVLMIIKIHPKQDITTMGIYNMSNIVVLTGEDVKRLKIDNYRLIKDSSALISDYSSIVYEYLLLDRPVAYVFSDLSSYKLGLCVDNLEEYLAGPVIENYEEMIGFIKDVVDNRDLYAKSREILSQKLFDYTDGKCCERLADFLKLES